MKIRECFISNSSSCSFIIVGNSDYKDGLSLQPWIKGDLGFSYGKWYDADSKLNFLMLQNVYNENNYIMAEKLKTFCKNHNIDYDEYYNYVYNCLYGESPQRLDVYIDHQSIIQGADDDYGIYDLFEEDEYIERFVLDKDSVLVMGRD